MSSAVLLCSLLALAGCSGGSELALVEQSFKTFAFSIPQDWQKIPQENFANTLPDETVALFLHRVAGDDFLQNVSVVKESLNTDASALEYAKANILLGSKALQDYRLVSREEVAINGNPTVYHIFRSRSVTTEPLRYYAQSYFTKDRLGYTITCIAKDEDLAQQKICEVVVKSFRFQG